VATKRQITSWLNRVQRALDKIPAGHLDGGPTISVKGVAGFQRDIQEFRKHFRLFVWAVSDGDNPERHVQEIERLAEDSLQSLSPPNNAN